MLKFIIWMVIGVAIQLATGSWLACVAADCGFDWNWTVNALIYRVWSKDRYDRLTEFGETRLWVRIIFPIGGTILWTIAWPVWAMLYLPNAYKLSKDLKQWKTYRDKIEGL